MKNMNKEFNLDQVPHALPVVNNRIKKASVAVLYSGGADSTYATCALGKEFSTVHLCTYERLGFFGGKVVLCHVERMRLRFPQVNFMHHFIPYDAFYSNLAYCSYLFDIRKYGFLVLASCGFCKVAMHWRNLIYCIDNGIPYAADGATVESKEYVEQNPRMLMADIKQMYAHFGITHLNPSYREGFSTEKALYSLGITEKEKIKRTKSERQIYCSQHILYAMVLRTFLRTHTFPEFEETTKCYFQGKIQYIVEMTEEYVKKRGKSRVHKLLRHE